MVRALNAEKRENLLAAALKLFVAKGVQNTSTAEIAREAGLAAGTLFLYFPTKQNLVDVLILKIGREQSEYIKALLADAPLLPARETFFTIWKGIVHWFLDNMQAYSFLQQVRDTSIVSQAAVDESSQFFGYYYDAIQQGLREGAIKPYPLDLIGEVLYQDIVAVMLHIRVQTDPARQAEGLQLGFDIFWNGIKAD